MTMTTCTKRAGLVWALLLLTTTCFILHTCAAPSGSTTPEPPSVSTTPIDGVESSRKTTEEVPITPTVSSDPISDDTTEEYLYYKIKKRIIFERNLTLSDIKYVLSQKDEEDQFMYALADKLGYMSEGGKPNDPHIPVIRSHMDKLIKLLEEMAAKKEPKPLVSREHDEGPTVSSNEMPASKEPPSPSDINKIAVEVSKDIRDLGPDAIRDILSNLFFSDTLGYTVGRKLGYLQGDEHMKYLEDTNTDELKKNLQRILELKTTSKTILSEPKQPNEPPPIPPTVKPPNIESGGNSQSTQAPSVGDISESGPDDGIDNPNGAESVPSGLEDSDPTPPTSHNSEDSDDHGATDQAPETEGEGETSPSEGYMRNSKESDGNTERPLSKDDKETDDADYGDGGFELIPIDEEKRMSLLNSDDFRKYLEETDNNLYKLFESSEVDADDIDMVHALQEYLIIKEEKRVGEDSGKLETGGDKSEPKEDLPDQPLDSDEQAKGALDSLGDDKDDVEYDRPRSSSSFGALHFLGIFLVLGVLVIIGYFCMHNRKKIREGVATYINDSSKRRRRAREYKPLIST